MTHPHHEAQGFTILLRALRIFSYVMALIDIVAVGIIAIGIVIPEGHFVAGAVLLTADFFCGSLFVAMMVETP